MFDRSENVTVRDRPRPWAEALGVRAGGGFLVYPKLSIDTAYDDNILGTQTLPLADTLFTIEPQLAIKSDWNKNAVQLTADTTLRQYVSYPSQDSNQYFFEGLGRLDLYHDLTVTADASWARVLIPRTSDAEVSKTPLLFDQALAEANVVKTFNRIKLTATGRFEHFTYLDGEAPTGQPLDQHFRDHDTILGDLRGDYAVSPDFAMFLEEIVTQDHYDTAARRTQNTTETLVGPNFEIAKLITADIGAGYLTSSSSARHAKTVETPHVRANIVYFATRLIDVTLTATQDVVDSGVPTSPSYLSRHLGVEANYELFRDLIIAGKVAANWNDYRDIDRHDRYNEESLAATYLPNRWMQVVLTYDHLNRTSSGAAAGASLGRNTVSLALTLQR